MKWRNLKQTIKKCWGCRRGGDKILHTLWSCLKIQSFCLWRYEKKMKPELWVCYIPMQSKTGGFEGSWELNRALKKKTL